MDSHATRGWFINDLHRHPLPYYFIKTVFNMLPLSRMMRSDGPISISRAFIADDWRRLLMEAGIAARADLDRMVLSVPLRRRVP